MNSMLIFFIFPVCVFAAIGIMAVAYLIIHGNSWLKNRRMMNLVKIGSRYRNVKFSHSTAKVINIQKSISGIAYVVYDEGIDGRTDISVSRIETFLDEYLCMDNESSHYE